MTITLTIDSVDSLPDGGPIRFQAHNRGFEIGRQQHLDWTLPDPSRYISGLHCDVRFEKGGYWLYDVSRNGTFLNGSTSRMKSPYRLASGDRLTIGQYVVSVVIEAHGAPADAVSDPFAMADQAPYGRAGAAPAGSASAGDIWDTGEPAPPPIDRRDLLPEPPDRRRAVDFSAQFIDLPELRPDAGVAPRPEPFATPPPARPAPPAAFDPFADAAPQRQPEPARAPPPDPFNGGEAFRAQPVPRPRQPPAAPDSESFGVAPQANAAPLAPMAAAPLPQAVPMAPAPVDHRAQAGQRFLEGLAAGAGVTPDTFMVRDPADIGFEVGEALRVTVEQVAQLLRARAAAKAMTKSSSRTMIGATDNNPLKFIPGASEAIDVMFTRRRPGFLGAKASLEGGFGDLKRHEMATFTAMQKALSRLLDDLSPEAISNKAGNSMLSSKKSRSWDIFVERWEAKTEPFENGMLDVFFAYFAEAYDEANKKG